MMSLFLILLFVPAILVSVFTLFLKRRTRPTQRGFPVIFHGDAAGPKSKQKGTKS